MKNLFFAGVLMILCTMQLNAQESSVKILLNEEERFRFVDQRLEFINPGYHVLIGENTGNNMDSAAVYNVFIGSSAGSQNTEGIRNSFLGTASGEGNTTGDRNSYFGANSGQFNHTGKYNSFFGQGAGYDSQGSYNTFIGRVAGYYNRGDSSVFLGYGAGAFDTASNKLYISNSTTIAPLVYGEFDNQILRFNASRLEIRNPANNTIIGDSAGTRTLGARNTFIGERSGYWNTDGHDNVFIGDSTGYENTTGNYNVFSGNVAGWKNTTGNKNVFLGLAAGMMNTEGNANVFIGERTGWQSTTGSRNAFVGTNAGFRNTSGIENTYLGTSAGASNTTGNFNTCLGRRSGLYNETGSSNLFIGYYAGANEMGSNKLYIANSDTTTPLIYGEFDNELLRIHGTLDIKGIYQFPTADGTSGQCMQTDGSGTLGWAKPGGDFSNGGEAGGADRSLGNTDDFALSFKTNDMTRLHLNNNGKIGIGTANPHGQFEVYKNSMENTTVGDFVVDTDNKKVYVGRLSTTPYNSSDFIVRNRFGHETFVVSAANYISLGNYNGAAEQMRVVFDGVTFGVGIGTTTPSAKLDIYNTTGYNQLRMQTSYTPTGSSDTNGNTGDIAWDDNYVYIKTTTGWKRTGLTTF